MIKKKNLLITGGLGLIGKSLIKILLKDFNLRILDTSPQIKRHKNYVKKFHKNEIKFISCNILNENKLNKIFNNIDIVIHLAAMLGVKNTESHKDLCWRINATATHYIVNACIKNKKFACSEGTQLRDFIYIDDVVEAIIKSLINKNARGQIINIGSGKPKKIKKVIEYIKKVSGGGYPQFGKIKLRKDEIQKFYPNVLKAKRKINWVPKISFEKGVKSTIKFYKENAI